MVALGLTFGPWTIASAGADPANATATAGNGSAGSSVTTLQIQAQELAGQINADGRTLDQLDASYQAAQIAYQGLTSRQAAMRRTVAIAATQVAAARQALKEQALLAYIAGGAPMVTQIPDVPGVDRSLTIAYAEIVSGGQQMAVQNYRATLDAETTEQAALEANGRQMAVTMRTIKSDADQAASTLTAERQVLVQVKGQLAAAVAQVQARQQAAQQAQEQATLTAEGIQLPPAGAAQDASAQTAGSQAAAPRSTGSADAAVQTVPPGGAPATAAVDRPARQSPAAPAPVATSATTAPPVSQPPPTAPPTPAPTGNGSNGADGIPAQAPDVSAVLAYARAQIGKPYQWAGAGPDSFDCSGLVMRAWEQASIDFPHLAQDQYDLTARLPLADLIPGDLVFFGTPDNVYHVGIYIGSGDMIDAPETGQNVQIQSIYWDSLLGAGRVSVNS